MGKLQRMAKGREGEEEKKGAGARGESGHNTVIRPTVKRNEQNGKKG
jgi:hypothetical protein